MWINQPDQKTKPRIAVVQGAKRRSEPLTARTDPGSFGEREKGDIPQCSDLSGFRAFPQG